MPAKIIVGYEGSERSRDALALARRLVRVTDAELLLANVYASGPGPYLGAATQRFSDLARRDAERTLHEAPAGVYAELRAIPSTSAARGLHELAEETGAELVVVGSTRRGKLGLIEPGATGELLLHGGPCAVAVAPAGYAEHAADRCGEVGVGYAGTEECRNALDAAIRLARNLEVRLRIIGVVGPPPDLVPVRGRAGEAEFLEELRQERSRQLDEALAAVPDDVQAEAVQLEGYPAWVLREQSHLDFLVIGSRGFGRIKGSLLGSVSARVVRGATVPVIVIPHDVTVTMGDRHAAKLVASA